jgi:hypothetical protein
VFWLSASIMMRDTPLMLTNFVMTAAGFFGIVLQNFIG